MSDEVIIYRLTGWLRLVKGDCIGIPLFTDGSNTEFLPETDDRLQITAFHAFYNVEGYFIDRCLPVNAKHVTYAVGTGVPIPFAKRNFTIIAETGKSVATFLEAQAGDWDNPIVRSVLEILEKSKSGVFQQENILRRDVSFKRNYAVVFLEEPVHSRYWIEQFKRAAFDRESMSDEEQQFVADQLQKAAVRWIERFLTSGDRTLLVALMSEVEKHGLVEPSFIKRVYHDVAFHMFSSQKYADLLSTPLAQKVCDAIPEGLYYYEFNLGGSRTSKTRKLPEDIDLLAHMKFILRDGVSRRDLRLASEAADMLFGEEALHPDIYNIVAGSARYIVSLIERSVELYKRPSQKSLIADILILYDALIKLRQIMDRKQHQGLSAVALGLPADTVFMIGHWMDDRAKPV